MNKPAPDNTSPTVTRTYSVQVLGMDGKPVEAGKPVKLPEAKARAFEARFGLEKVAIDK